MDSFLCTDAFSISSFKQQELSWRAMFQRSQSKAKTPQPLFSRHTSLQEHIKNYSKLGPTNIQALLRCKSLCKSNHLQHLTSSTAWSHFLYKELIHLLSYNVQRDKFRNTQIIKEAMTRPAHASPSLTCATKPVHPWGLRHKHYGTMDTNRHDAMHDQKKTIASKAPWQRKNHEVCRKNIKETAKLPITWKTSLNGGNPASAASITDRRHRPSKMMKNNPKPASADRRNHPSHVSWWPLIISSDPAALFTWAQAISRRWSRSLRLRQAARTPKLHWSDRCGVIGLFHDPKKTT